MAHEKAEEPPQAHHYRIGQRGTTDDPSRVRLDLFATRARAPYDPEPDPSFSAALAARIERSRPVASLLLHLEVDDYDAWKPIFDSDPAGRKQSATGHSISRSVDNPNAIFIRSDYPTVEEAKAMRQRLLDSGALERSDSKIIVPPTVVEVAEAVTY